MGKLVRPALRTPSPVPCACEDDQPPFKALLDASLDVICSVDREGRFTYVSAASKRVWGYDPRELLGRKYMELVVPSDHERTADIASAIIAGLDVTSFENHYIRKDGSIVPILWSARWSEPEETMYCVAKDATQKKRIEEQNNHLHRRLKRAYKLASIAWWEYDIATGVYTASDEIFEMYGLPIPENNQTTLDDFLCFVHPDDRPRLERDIAATRLHTNFNYEHRIVKPNGEVIYVIHYFEVIRNYEGIPVSIHGTAKDITKRKTYQLKLEESEKNLQRYAQRLTDILESIGDGFFTVDKQWTVTYWNRQAEKLLRKKREDIVGKDLWQEYKDAVSLLFYTEHHRAVQDDIPVQLEEYFPPLDMWIEVAAYPSAEGLSVYFKDITEKKRQEQALQLVNERFELAAKATSDVFWDWDIETNNCYFSDAFTRLYGHENKHDSAYKNWVANIHPDDKKEVLQSLNDALLNLAVSKFEAGYRFLRSDGSIAHVLDRGFIIRDGEGEATRMVGSIQDITRLKRKAEELKKLSLVAKETVNAVVITDKDERITWVNQAFTDITEYSFEEAIGKKPSEFLQGKNTSKKTKTYLKEQIQKGLPFHCDIVNYSKSGREYWIELKGQPILNEKGEVEQFFAIETDITERIELQKMVVEEKIEAQREITRAIIQAQEGERTEIGKELHDNVNQLLATIKLYMENIRHCPEFRDMFIDKGIELAKKAIEESRNLSHRLVASSIAEASFRVAINELLSHYELLNIFSIKLQFTVCEDKLSPSFRLTIYRIVQECLTNVVKYAKATEVNVAILYEDKLVKVIISDNGVGFNEATNTAGIGLTNMRNRASLFKGHIQVAAAPQQGCTIKAFFPTINDQVIEIDEDH